jgi:DNA-binding SARP family transcriptional activator
LEGTYRVSLCLLGDFRLLQPGSQMAIAPPSQRVLVLLGLNQGHSIRRSQVAGTLWPESREPAALSNLRSALWKLGSLRDSLLEVTNEVLSFKVSIPIDIERHKALARRLTEPASDAGLDHASRRLFDEDLLPGWGDAWLETEREAYRHLRLHALETISHHRTMAGRFGEAIEAGLIAVSAAPFRESAHRAVIQALVAEGNRGEALRRYQDLCELFDTEFGVKPSFSVDQLSTGVGTAIS